MKRNFRTAAFAASTLLIAGAANAAGVMCTAAGPQTPRDIASVMGKNTPDMAFAPASTELNLCNIHTHTHAEHKGPGFSVFMGDEEHGGYACNEAADLTEAELADDHSGGHGVKPGETIEVHWVHTSCDTEGAAPGPSLAPCIACENPQVRVETQVFLVVNDHDALDFSDFMYDGNMVDGRPQPKALPTSTGEPVQFWGSTTGPSYDNGAQCSPYTVTWSVRPQCAKVDVATVNAWFATDEETGARHDGTINVFKENHSHGVRQLVVDPALLSQIGG